MLSEKYRPRSFAEVVAQDKALARALDVWPMCPPNNLTDGRLSQIEPRTKLTLGNAACRIRSSNLADLVLCQLRVSVLLPIAKRRLAEGAFQNVAGVSNVGARRDVFQVGQSVILLVPVLVVGLEPWRAGANERFQNKSMHQSFAFPRGTRQDEVNVAVRPECAQSWLADNRATPSTVAPHTTKIRHRIPTMPLRNRGPALVGIIHTLIVLTPGTLSSLTWNMGHNNLRAAIQDIEAGLMLA